jgi:hypothetical protein
MFTHFIICVMPLDIFKLKLLIFNNLNPFLFNLVSLKSSPLFQYAIQHPEHERNRLAPLQYLDPSFSEGNSILEVFI